MFYYIEDCKNKKDNPPAILKSLAVIPSILKIASPTATNARLTTTAVSMDSLTTVSLLAFDISSVIEINIGRTTKISIATKIGINVFSSTLKKFSMGLIIIVNDAGVKAYLLYS